MNTPHPLFARALAALILFLSGALMPARASNLTQTWLLRPGWNSIHVELEPVNPDPSAVFAGLNIESVWTFSERLTSVDFIQSTNEPLWNRSSWLVHIPSNHPAAFQTSLFRVLGNRPYLVNITNATPVTLVVTGRPSFRPMQWAPDAYTLSGFPVDPANRPSFFSYFRWSSAHYNDTSAQLNKIYRLAASGQWQLVSGTDLMEHGIAYWVFTRGGSDFQAPLGLSMEFGDGLNYGAVLSEKNLTLKNATTGSKQVQIRDAITPGATPLSYPNPDPIGANRWLDVPIPLNLTIPADSDDVESFAIRRQDMSAPTYATVLDITDGTGTRWRVPVSAEKGIAPPVSGTPPPAPVLEARNRAGLWVGNVSLDAVAEVNSGSLVTNGNQEVVRLNTSTNTTPVKTEMLLRLLIHVDTNGTARLLKEVVQMWKDGTYTNDLNGLRFTATPGRYVLLTDDARIADFKGVAVIDGQSVGRRLSTATYDWDGTNTFVLMNGDFALNNRITCSLSLLPTTPANPFRHKYHPDHDNLDAAFSAYQQEAYPVVRQIELVLSPTPPPDATGADYGYSIVGGSYRETITGLHQDALITSGTFILTRVSTTGVLNQ